MSDRTTLKSFFENGDRPDEIQFEDLIDSLAHLADDLISQAEAEGGVSTTPRTWSSERVNQAIGAVLKTDKSNRSKSSNFTFVLPSNSKLLGIDFRWVSGSPTYRVGTSSGGNQIVLQDSLTTNERRSYPYEQSYAGSQTLYFTLSGGTIDVNINYKVNDF